MISLYGEFFHDVHSIFTVIEESVGFENRLPFSCFLFDTIYFLLENI